MLGGLGAVSRACTVAPTRLGVLGPLVVWDGEGREVQVPEVKVRALLADLLANDGGPVSADRLIHDLWADAPPANPAGALQATVSQLRRAIGRDRVVRQPPGYRLRFGDTDDETDAVLFRALVARARPVGDPRFRAELLTEALELWGPVAAAVESFCSLLQKDSTAALSSPPPTLPIVLAIPLRLRARANFREPNGAMSTSR